MAVPISFLTALWLACGCSAMAADSCLTCHQSHYARESTCTGCHRGDDRTVRKDLAHLNLVPGHLLRYLIPGNTSVPEGEQWLFRSACRRCHVIKGEGNRLAADLDRVSGRNPAALLSSILNPVEFMPDYRFEQNTVSLMVNAILAHAEKIKARSGRAPVPVRFTAEIGTVENIFEKQCGGCHRMLTARFKGLGKGSAGPNLSGLLSGRYPKTYNTGEQWTEQRLEQWLKNPRQSRPLARMQPVQIDREQFRQLLLLINSENPSAKSRQFQ